MSTVKFGPGVIMNPIPLSAPFIGSATLLSTASTTALVSYTVPSYTGCIPILKYVATSNQGGITATLTQSGSGTITVNGLSYGNTYTFVVSAFNGFGQGPASTSSNSVSPIQIPPGPPQLVSAAFATASCNAYISFAAPACNGGSPVLYYTAVSNPGLYRGTLSQAGSGSILVSGLQGNTYYTFTVSATNAIGTGTNSASSNSIYYHNPGSYVYTSPGPYTFYPGCGVCKVSVAMISGGNNGATYGGGSGGQLTYANCIPVTHGVGVGFSVGGPGGNSTFCTYTAYGGAGGGSYGYGGGGAQGGGISGGHGGNGTYAGGGGGGIGFCLHTPGSGTAGGVTSPPQYFPGGVYGSYVCGYGGCGYGGGGGQRSTLNPQIYYPNSPCLYYYYYYPDAIRGGAGGSYGGGGGGAACVGPSCHASPTPGSGASGAVKIVVPGSVTQRIRRFPSTCV